MRVSTKVEYGLIAIIDIAMYSEENQSVTSIQISEHHNISKKFLEQIMTSLRTAKLVNALKGARGGYRLSKDPKDIRLTEILNALDVSILEDVSTDNAENSNIKDLINKNIWQKMNQSLVEIADSITLKSLLDDYKNSQTSTGFMYYI
jgi:Rrf2 family protein